MFWYGVFFLHERSGRSRISQALGVTTPQGSTYLLFGIFFGENCMKRKKNLLRVGGVPTAPSPRPTTVSVLKSCYRFRMQLKRQSLPYL